jgi:hypothetical protein
MIKIYSIYDIYNNQKIYSIYNIYSFLEGFSHKTRGKSFHEIKYKVSSMSSETV